MKWISILIAFFLIASGGHAQLVFNPLNGPTGGNLVAIERTSTSKLFALTQKSLYESTNNGGSWTKVLTINLQNQGPVSLLIDNSDKIYVATKSAIHTSIDAGSTWTEIAPTGDYNPSKRLQKNETTGSLFIIGYYDIGLFYGIQKSSDDGLTWADVSPVATQINDYAIKNTGSFSHIYCSPNSGDKMYKSTDDAAGWNLSNTGLPNGVSFSYEPGIVVNKFNGKIYCLPYSSQGVFESSDEGATWASVTTGSPITFADGSGQYGVFASETSDRIFIRHYNDLYYNDTPFSTPTAWTLFNLGNSDPPTSLLSYTSNILLGLKNDFRNADGILKSTNSGSNWTYANIGILEYETTSSLRANNGRLMAINGSGTLNSSTNDGASWSKIKLCDNCGLRTLIKKTNGDILAVGDRTYQSVDDGLNWALLGAPHVDYIDRLATSDGGATIFGTGGFPSKLYKSVDGGASFSELILTGISGVTSYYGVVADNANNVYLYTDTQEVYSIPGPANTTAAKITNSGITNIFGINAVGANIYIVGDNGPGSSLAKSTDQGANWTIQPTDDTYELVMISDELIFARNFDSQISFSNDAGVNWNLAYDPGLSFVGLVSAFIDDNGIAYVSASEGPMYKSSSTVVMPNKPTNFKTIATSDNTVYLEWDYDNSGGAVIDGFIIERKLTSGGTFAEIGFPDSNERYFVDRSTTKNTGYDYRVIADNLAGTNFSDPVSLTTSDDCALTIPDNRSWAGSVDGGAFINDPISIRKYNSDYFLISDFTAGSLSPVAGLFGGTFGQANVTTIFAENCGTPFIEQDDNGDVFPNGNGTWNGTNSITLKFQIDKTSYVDTEKIITLTLNASDPTPEIPQNLSAVILSNSSIQLEWSPGDYQQKYLIERSLVSGSGFSQAGMVDYPTLAFVDSGPFTEGVEYFYRIKAQNGNTPIPGESAYSGEASVVFAKPIFVLSSTIVSSTFASAPSVAWGDFDNDGFEDLIMPVVDFVGFGSNEPLLFRNNAGTDFQLITGKIPAGTNYFGPAVGDYNNDDLLDVFATGLTFEGAAQTKNGLIRNDGNLDFTELASSIVAPQEVGQSTFGGSWVDINNDGYLDLFIPYEDVDGQKLFNGTSSGVFAENTTAGGLISDSFSKGGAFWADYDNDGDMDVFVLGNSVPNRLYRNDAGVFTHVTPSVFDSQSADIFTASWGDYNNDQFLDLFLGDEGGQNFLYKNNGDGTFTKEPTVANSPTENISALTFGSAWGDVDNDGDLDLLIVNAGESNALYINQGGGTFNKATNESITGFSTSFDLGAAFADYDNDGHLDVVVGALTFPQGQFVVPPDDPLLKLYRNNVTTGNWLKVKLIGAATTQPLFSNRAAIGARVKIVAGGVTQIREISTLTGVGSQSSLIAHFGLGSETTITSLQIKWPSGIVQNLSDVTVNQQLNIVEDNVGPVASVLLPANAATGINANTTLSVTLNEASTPASGKFVTLFKTSDLGTPIITFDATIGAVSGETYTFTPSQNLEPLTSYSISVDEGAFIDIYGNESAAITTPSWQFTSAAGPAVTLLNPTDLSSDVAINTLLEITFDKAFTALAGKNLTVTVQGGVTPTYTLSVSSGTITGNKVTYTLPGPLGGFTTYDVAVDAGAFTDSNSNVSASIAWSFSTVDNTAPVVNSFSPPTSLDKGFGTTVFEASVMDDSGTSSVVLSHRKIGGSAFTDLVGVYNSTTMMYEFTVQESFFDATGMESFVKAYDFANNETIFPESPDGRIKTFLNYQESDSKIPASVIGFGGQVGNWKIFAIPFDLGAGNSVTSVFDELSALTYKIDWRMLTYVNDAAWGEYPTEFAQFVRGKGYFINIKSAVDLFVGAVSAPNNSRSNLFQLTLKPGWNQIGNPYLTPISWSDVSTLNGLTGLEAQLKKFATGSYVNATDLQPFEGGFVFVEGTVDVPVLIPFAGQTAVGGRQKKFSSDISNEEWQVPMILSQGGIQNDLSGVGMSPEASASIDNFDDINPPRFVKFLEMNFDHPEHLAKQFSKDVVPTQNKFTWEFTVASNLEGMVTLQWDNSSFGSNQKDLILVDVTQQVPIDMRISSSYTFDATLSGHFEVHFGENIKTTIQPERIVLGKAYPNPVNGLATIPFTLPSATETYHVRLEVYDMMGRKVDVLQDGMLPSGFYESKWDVSNNKFKNGLYTYRLIVSGDNRNEVFSEKIILNK